MSVVVHITSEEQEKKYFELFYKLYPKATKPSTRSYWYKYDKDVGFNMNNGNSFSVTNWSHYQRNAKQYDYELIEFDEFLKRFDPSFKKRYRFKVGDKVRVIDTSGHSIPIGDVGEITKIRDNYDKLTAYNVKTLKQAQLIEDYQLELAEPQPKFKVGDVVKGNQTLCESQIKLKDQDEIVEITELNAEQYYGRVGEIITLHPRTSHKISEWSKEVMIVRLDFAKNLILKSTSGDQFLAPTWIDSKQGVTIKFTDNKQLNQQTMKSKEEIYEAMQAEWLRITGLKVGDYVKCTRSWEKGEQGFSYCSVRSGLIGGTQQISAINKRSIDCPEGDAFPFFVLEPVEAPEKKYELEDNTRTVTIKEDDSIECGCLKLTKDNAVKALKNIEELNKTFKGYDMFLVIEGSEIRIDDVEALKKLLK